MDFTKEASNLLILVDGSSYLYRAFYALPPLINTKGQATGAIKGVVSMLNSLRQQFQPKYMVVTFDAKGKNFRHHWYADYKANRSSMPEELQEQIEPLYQLVEALGFPLLSVEGVEADDVIGTLAKEAEKKGMDTLISTGDKDMAQLVSAHTHLIDTMKNQYMDEKGVKEKFNISASQIIDYLALMGDKSDNIPGVDKVGPKTAVKWLKEYGSLKNVMDNCEKIKGKVGENLRASLDFLPLSYRLATIKCDVELHTNIDACLLAKSDNEKLFPLLEELEFKSMLASLKAEAKEILPTPSPALSSYKILFNQDELLSYLEEIKQQQICAFDTETTSLNIMEADIVGVSFSIKENEAVYIPVAHDYEGAPPQIKRNDLLKKIKPVLEDEKIIKIGQNLKYDINVLKRVGIEMKGVAFDTMLESYVYNSSASRHDMDSLALKYLGIKTTHFEDVAGKGVKQLKFNQIDVEKAGHYAAEDADITWQLHQKLYQKIKEQSDALAVFNEIEIPLINILAKMEFTGVKIDAKKLAAQSEELKKTIENLEQQAYQIAGREFNLASPKQLSEILFDEQQLPVVKKTKSGAKSTAEEVLKVLAKDYELPKVILDFRHVKKLKTTYTDVLPKMISCVSSRIHTSYHQAVAITGRLSSSSPNLQNIPIKTSEGRKIREAFIAEAGNKIIAADYSQIELRIMAHLSEDQNLVNAFNQGLDVHRATAAEILGVDITEVSDEARRQAKAVNFGLIYGMSAFGLAKQLGITRKEAQSYIQHYFTQYPGVFDYMERTKALAREKGYVETIYGRRLYLPNINAKNVIQRQAAERMAINAPMQGSAADIIKRAMIKVDEFLSTNHLQATMIMQVHDELVLEVPELELDKVCLGLKHAMSDSAKLIVNLDVELGVGDNWQEAH